MTSDLPPDFDPDDVDLDEIDADRMYRYLKWRIGPNYTTERDHWGSPRSARYDEGVEYAHENERAWALLNPLLDSLDMTPERARQLLELSKHAAEA